MNAELNQFELDVEQAFKQLDTGWGMPTSWYHDTSRAHAERGGWFEFHAPGGGGVGHPFERDPERVADDVRSDLVSIEGAKAEYGVVIEPGSGRVDVTATGQLRRR